MSNPDPRAESETYYDWLKNKIYEETGLVKAGKNEDEEEEWIGTRDKFIEAERLLEIALDEKEF